MANWQRELNIKEVWQREPPPYEIAAAIATGLKAMQPLPSKSVESTRKELIEAFEWLAEDKCQDVAEFDFNMRQLYDWADTPLDASWNGKKVCWVRAF